MFHFIGYLIDYDPRKFATYAKKIMKIKNIYQPGRLTQLLKTNERVEMYDLSDAPLVR